ncbi:MAG: hypothetical protein A2Y33_06165 [Spirochaetes bacterium GWF1_51_8]|nr:MAG: hypothetical protein A2Y33_06165 [Spirochaetes bacterium GWF1_51_8]
MEKSNISGFDSVLFPVLSRLHLLEYSCAVISSDSNLIEATELFSSIFSIGIQESLGHNLFELLGISPESKAEFESYIHGIFGDGSGAARVFPFLIRGDTIHVALMGFTNGNGRGILFAEAVRADHPEWALLEKENSDILIPVDHIPIGFCVHSKGVIVYVNKTALEILAARPGENYIGKSAIEFVHPDYRAKAIERIGKILTEKGEMPLMEEKFVKSDGTYIDVEVFGTYIEYHGVPATLVLFRGIGARKDMEERLRNSEKRYRELFNSMLDGFAFHKMVFDENNRPVDYIFLEMNPAFEKMSGLSAEEVVGKKVMDVLPDTEPFWIETFGKVASTGESARFENYTAPLDKYFEVTAYSSAKGYFACIFRDITPQKHAEQALKQERDLLDHVMEISPVALTIVDRDGQIVFANRKAEEVLGLSRREIESRTYNAPAWKILSLDGTPFSETEIPVSKVLATKEPVSNIRHLIELPSGEKCLLSVNGTPLFNDAHEIEKVILTFEDITEANKIERALTHIIEASSLTGTDFFNSMVLGFSEIFDIDYVLIGELSVSGGGHVQTLSVCRRNMLIENFEYGLKDTPCEDVLEKKFCIFPSGIRGLYPNAKLIRDREIEGYGGIALYSSKSKPIGFLVVMNTKPIVRTEMIERFVKLFAARISSEIERLHIEEERGKIEDQLRQAQKMESIGRLAGGIAHDFNNMLTPIIGYADMFLNYELTPEHPFYAPMKDLYDAAIRAKNLTHQLLAFSRKQMLILKKVYLNEIIGRFYSMLRRTIRENIEIKFEAETGLWSVEADTSQIEQILLNLCVNSQDAIYDRGEIRIETKNMDIEKDILFSSDVLNAGKYVLLRVTDSGEGIDDASIKLIFEPFFTTKKDFGTGLGLATVYGIVKQHNGHIEVESSKDGGTKFSIYFPRADTEFNLGSHADEQGLVPSIPKASSTTILVVEDDVTVRKLTESILKKCGFNIFVAEDGTSALRLYVENKDKIGLLLTDLIMPDMTGKELSVRIKEITPDIKVLFMSGYSGNLLNSHGFKEEENFYIQKPFSMNQLVEKIRRII